MIHTDKQVEDLWKFRLPHNGQIQHHSVYAETSDSTTNIAYIAPTSSEQSKAFFKPILADHSILEILIGKDKNDIRYLMDGTLLDSNEIKVAKDHLVVVFTQTSPMCSKLDATIEINTDKRLSMADLELEWKADTHQAIVIPTPFKNKLNVQEVITDLNKRYKDMKTAWKTHTLSWEKKEESEKVRFTLVQWTKQKKSEEVKFTFLSPKGYNRREEKLKITLRDPRDTTDEFSLEFTSATCKYSEKEQTDLKRATSERLTNIEHYLGICNQSGTKEYSYNEDDTENWEIYEGVLTDLETELKDLETELTGLRPSPTMRENANLVEWPALVPQFVKLNSTQNTDKYYQDRTLVAQTDGLGARVYRNHERREHTKEQLIKILNRENTPPSVVRELAFLQTAAGLPPPMIDSLGISDTNSMRSNIMAKAALSELVTFEVVLQRIGYDKRSPTELCRSAPRDALALMLDGVEFIERLILPGLKVEAKGGVRISGDHAFCSHAGSVASLLLRSCTVWVKSSSSSRMKHAGTKRFCDALRRQHQVYTAKNAPPISELPFVSLQTLILAAPTTFMTLSREHIRATPLISMEMAMADIEINGSRRQFRQPTALIAQAAACAASLWRVYYCMDGIKEVAAKLSLVIQDRPGALLDAKNFTFASLESAVQMANKKTASAQPTQATSSTVSSSWTRFIEHALVDAWKSRIQSPSGCLFLLDGLLPTESTTSMHFRYLVPPGSPPHLTDSEGYHTAYAQTPVWLNMLRTPTKPGPVKTNWSLNIEPIAKANVYSAPPDVCVIDCFVRDSKNVTLRFLQAETEETHPPTVAAGARVENLTDAIQRVKSTYKVTGADASIADRANCITWNVERLLQTSMLAYAVGGSNATLTLEPTQVEWQVEVAIANAILDGHDPTKSLPRIHFVSTQTAIDRSNEFEQCRSSRVSCMSLAELAIVFA